MKRIALILVLAIVVAAGALLTGVATGGGAGPTISLSPTSGPAGTQVVVNGWCWTPGAVTLYMDSVDSAHLLATTTASGIGCFRVSFKMTATTVGQHKVIATQPAGQASAVFTLTVTDPLDERTLGLLSGIGDDLAEIKADLAGVPRIECYHDCIYLPNGTGGNLTVFWTSHPYNDQPYSAAHFSVTLDVEILSPGDSIHILKEFWSADHNSGMVPSIEITAEGQYTYEFDASGCEIIAPLYIPGTDQFEFCYAVTVTYGPET